MKYLFIGIFLSCFPTLISSQNQPDSIQKLDEVILESHRITVPLSQNSHTVTILKAEEINKMAANSLEEALQNCIGIDVRRRGLEGMQSDLYIRGGSFEQVLILVDGIKMDDSQTGHHSMNAILAIDNIERIEIIKGAASRIYGHNAMNGAINIITKKPTEDAFKTSFSAGSFDTYGASASFQKVLDKGTTQLGVHKLKSQGYRFNTDFDNWSAFFKTEINQFELLASYAERKFGANGFYASPAYKDQYEETQTHLLALKQYFSIDNWNLTAQTYWRSNIDDYVFVRTNPNLYHNTHKNHKIGISLDGNLQSKLGITGLGFDINQGYLKSNNLGNRNRFSTTFFAEQRFQFFHNTLDLTPGIALTHYSDFKSFFYPGIDVGYRINKKLKIYANTGLTSRIPTYTDLYYNSPAELGSSELKPEKAFTNEFGFYFMHENLQVNAAYFYRKSTDIIDWTKALPTDKWQVSNIGEVVANGIEFNADYRFKIQNLNQKLNLGYTHLKETYLDRENLLSRYEINSFKNQITANVQTQWVKNLSQNFTYRYVARWNGNTYKVLDASIALDVKKWQLQLQGNNLFNETYSETNLVPMPKFNMMASISYQF